jgi:hypothetical protein
MAFIVREFVSVSCLPLDLGSSAEDDAAEELWEGLEHSLQQLGGW